MTATTTAPTDPVAAAFTRDRQTLIDADDLARRIAAGKLDKGDTPDAIRDTFEAAGFAEGAAAGEVSRHKKIIEAEQTIAAAGPAREECRRIDAKIAALVEEQKKTRKRIEAELKNLNEARVEPDLRAKRESFVRRELTGRLLPGYVLGELDEIRAELLSLAPSVQRLEAMTPFRELAVDKETLADMTSASRRQDERDRVKVVNSEREAAHLALRYRLQQSKDKSELLQDRDQELRKVYRA